MSADDVGQFRFYHPAQCMSQARYALMLPHRTETSEAIAEAFRNCYDAFYRINEARMDSYAIGLMRKIQGFMKLREGETPQARARRLRREDRRQLCSAVDELADWFNSYGR
jgi:hypothetical protein